MIALARRISLPTLLAVTAALAALAVLALTTGTQDARAASSKTCQLSERDQRPPGGTSAYNLRVKRQHVSCRMATKVMRAFHRCRTDSRSRCARKVLTKWTCAGRSNARRPTFHGTFTCSSGSRRVKSSYYQDTPKCFGAAARDRMRPCKNPTLSVFPKLGGVDPDETWRCDPELVKRACVFGVPEAQSTGSFALLGDSHTRHWMSALSVVAKVKRWTGYTIATGGCFFSEAVGAFLPGCVPWYRGALEWFEDHPEVSTVFVTSLADTPVEVPAGKTYLGVKIDGFRRAFQALPQTVKRIVVLRDTPWSRPAQDQCLKRVVAAGKERPGPACPLARPLAVREDTGVLAARSLHSKRYQYIDMTRYFCSTSNCFGVIGGASVHIDIWGHIVTTYMRTLGPYLLRKVNALR